MQRIYGNHSLIDVKETFTGCDTKREEGFSEELEERIPIPGRFLVPGTKRLNT